MSATIPAKIRSDTPLPIPFSDISSPIHIKITVPPATAKIEVKSSNPPISPISPWDFKKKSIP